jgi:hypothetical protein
MLTAVGEGRTPRDRIGPSEPERHEEKTTPEAPTTHQYLSLLRE